MMRQRKVRTGAGMGAARLERLEQRQLLSTTLDGDVLRIITGAGPDAILLSHSGNSLVVQENRATSQYDFALVRSISVVTGTGSDRVQASDIDLPITADLGAGNDTILTGGGNDTIHSGSGSDLVSTGAGADVVYGDSGADRIMTGDGNDIVWSSSKSDLVNTGSGSDVVNGKSKTINTGKARVYEPASIVSAFQGSIFTSNVTGYDPNQVRQAYGYGDYDPTAGTGQTIYIVDAFTGLNIQDTYDKKGNLVKKGDFTVFCEQFDLPVPTKSNFRIVNMSQGGPAVDSGWAMEIMLDLEWARAMAPAAKIVLVQADSDISNDMYRAVKAAADMAQNVRGGVVSMSFGTNHIYDPAVPGYSPLTSPDMVLWDNVFRTHSRVTFLAASGDNGAGLPGATDPVAMWPAMSPYVTAVGGTVLTIDQDGNPTAEESAWIDGGSGYALPDWYERPTYQDGIQYSAPLVWVPVMTNIAVDENVRGIPDVSYNAGAPYAVYVTTPQSVSDAQGNLIASGARGWFAVGGTSAGTPQWAAIVALANQKRKVEKLPLVGNKLNGMLYDIYNGYATNKAGDSVDYEDCFNDVIFGQAGPWAATTGYDMATGIGTPKVATLLDTMSDYTGFFIQKDFSFNGRLYMPFSVASAGLVPVATGQLHSGSGSIIGNDTLTLQFLTDPVKYYGPNFTSKFVPDRYFDSTSSDPSAFRVTLHRTGRGKSSGRIYGIGGADIFNADAAVSLGMATFTLAFNGTWWTGSDGQIHFNIHFGAVDPVTFDPLPSKPGDLVSAPSLPSQGAYYSGSITG